MDTQLLPAGQEVVGGPDRLGDEEHAAVLAVEGGFAPGDIVDKRVGGIPRVREFAVEGLDGSGDVARNVDHELRDVDGDIVSGCDGGRVAFVPV